MGIHHSALEFLLEVRKDGIDFGDMVTIGRMDFLCSFPMIEQAFDRYGVAVTRDDISRFYTAADQFSEPILEFLGSRSVQSLDMSDFEGATIVHDLSEPIPDQHKKRVDLVFDSGTLEHVFNFPQAIRNCMEMAKVGGHVICVTPANNYLGHGFYQFSPELFYRVFSEENGFRVKKMLYRELSGECYEVADPAVVRNRVQARGIAPAELLILAERTADVPMFTANPQQSDYAAEWQAMPEKGTSLERLHFWKGSKTPEEVSPLKAMVRKVRAPLGRFRRRFLREVVLRKHNLVLNPDHFSRRN